MNNPFVSIIMPSYNSNKTIKEAIESVLNQTYENWELIVVDDCSTDNTIEIVQAIEDHRIHILLNEKNRGVSYSRNRAIHEAKAEWIAFLDSDDCWEKDKLEKQIKVIHENEDAKLVFTGSAFIDDSGNRLEYELKVPEEITYEQILKQNLISCSSVLVRKDIIRSHPFPGSYDLHEDFAVWLQILKSIKVAYGVNEPLLIYRLTDNSKSRNKLKAAKMNWKTYRYAGVDLGKSLSSMAVYAIRGIKKYWKLNKKK